MLLVPTELDPKTGRLVSLNKIKAGKEVWKFVPGLGEVAVLPPRFCVEPFNVFVQLNGFQVDGSWYLSVDDSRFVGHERQQERPLRKDQGPNLAGDWSVWKARREIAVGELLTIDRERLGWKAGPEFVNTIPEQSASPDIGESHPTMGGP